MKKLIFSLFITFCSTLTPALAAERIVNIFNWSDYIDPSVLEDFTRETGIKVIYDTYDTTDALEARLIANPGDYDLIVPSATTLQRLIQADALQTLDRKRLANAVNIWPEIDNRLRRFDPNNAHAVNYLWSTIGVGYNAAKLKDRAGKPIVSWDQALRPEGLKRFSDCGVGIADNPDEILPIALNLLKIDPNSKNLDQLRRAADLLSGLRRLVKKFDVFDYSNALAFGEMCFAVGRTGEILQARARAKEIGPDTDIVAVLPNEGSLMILDNLAIPRNAPHVNEAYVFIDYLLRPDVAARNVKATNYASGVETARNFLDPALANDPALYPDQATLARLFTVTSADQPTRQNINRLWTSVKTGR
ncbi:MAG: extracellular solute-binding protein [Methylocystaceae bacterium]|nr:extracellular solute-binding protein [Methylocystaceae bacterium]NBT96243.1 extracellular solute-binding protein [Methylocystaceae bacterium]